MRPTFGMPSRQGPGVPLCFRLCFTVPGGGVPAARNASALQQRPRQQFCNGPRAMPFSTESQARSRVPKISHGNHILFRYTIDKVYTV